MMQKENSAHMHFDFVLCLFLDIKDICHFRLQISVSTVNDV